VQQAILDGELVALTAGGASSFRDLQDALSRKQTAQLTYQVFDLVYLDGHDLSALPLIERKQALAQLLQAAGYDAAGVVRYSDHVQGQGPDFFEQACSLGLEGIISKRADAAYRSGRGKLWLKVKCSTQHDEFVVGGYTPPAGARSGFGALLLGTFRDGQLEYAGRLGTGFSNHQLEQLHAQLQKDEIAKSPLLPPRLCQFARRAWCSRRWWSRSSTSNARATACCVSRPSWAYAKTWNRRRSSRPARIWKRQR
jgi:bifunctional non-homologous end joining protein LigD